MQTIKPSIVKSCKSYRNRNHLDGGFYISIRIKNTGVYKSIDKNHSLLQCLAFSSRTINRPIIKSSYGKQKTLHSTTLHFRGENNPRVYNVTSINDIHIDITLINASSPRAFFLSMLRAFGMRTIKPIVVVRTCSPVQMHASILLIRDIIPAFVRSVTRNSVFQGLL